MRTPQFGVVVGQLAFVAAFGLSAVATALVVTSRSCEFEPSPEAYLDLADVHVLSWHSDCHQLRTISYFMESFDEQ